MATCPTCGERVPFGGGRTVKNAHLMFMLAGQLRQHGEQVGDTDFSFVDRGTALAKTLHDYGHKYSMVNPDWKAAGMWTRVAREAVERIPAEESASGREPSESGVFGGPNPWSLGERFAQHAYDQILEDGQPPASQEEIDRLVDEITPGAVHDIGVMMANARGQRIAVPKEVVAKIENGFRQRLRELLSQHVA